MKKHVVYVYGSLRPGNGDKYYIPGKMYGFGGFPAVSLDVEHEAETPTVVCERLEVTDKQLERLDNYEGYDVESPRTSLYIRVRCREGWIYEYNGTLSETQRVPSGDWLAEKKQSRGHAFDHFLDDTALEVTPMEGVGGLYSPALGD